MKKIIEKEIAKKRKLFKENYAEMVGAYKREKETTKDYNGRQLLELIQNADDAGSNAILIKIDTKNSILTISNKGEAFTKEGYRSLMIQNLSSKLKKSYIGNKGLGFRSIINWSDSITIISNGTTVEFSEEKRKQEFHNLFNENERLDIINEFSFAKNVNPLPFLAIPIIKESSSNSDFTTSIEIKYRHNFFKDILTQVKDLKEEVLLFLNNINKIEIQGFDDINNIEIKGEKSIGKPISIGNRKWTVFEKSGLLEEKYQDKTNTQKEHYQLKIAIPLEFENETDLLFTFFPTKVNLEFPFVVHGTFDLDSSRNQLVKSDKNQFVLEKLIELIIETAKNISKEKVSWKPLELLNYNNKNKVLTDLDFYENIDKKIEELELFPCIDGLYRKLSETVMYNNDFTNYIIETENISYFSNLLIPINSNLKQWLSTELDLSFWVLKTEYFIKNIDEISKKIKTLNDRVNLIYILEQDNSFHSDNQQYSLLLNEDKKVIDKSISVFTPPTTKSEKFDLPDFVKIDFLNKYFYTKLLNKYDLSNHKEKARELQRKLKEIVSISQFQPIPVIGKVITETNRKIKKSKNKNDVNIITKKMILSLYNIHKDLNETTNPDTSKVRVITQSGKIQLANELYLSADYPSGELTEDLFKGILPKNKFVSSRRTLGLEKEDSISVERFLLDFLKVNKHTKIQTDFQPEYQYESFVFDKVVKPASFRYSFIRVSKIENLEIILNKISKEKLILWLLSDSFLNQQLNNSYNNDTFEYDKKAEREGYYYHTIDIKPSYIKHQLLQQEIFNNLLITDEKLAFINDTNINYSHKLFTKYHIEKDKINSILLELGAKENFSDLSIERVSEVLGSLEERDTKGKTTQKIYKLAFEHYRKNKEELIITDDFKLFSTKEKNSDYFAYSEVYYSDNSKLPKKIINQEAILNFPKRIGESQVSAFFGIKTFKDFKIQVKTKELNTSMTLWLNDYLRSVKPYLLSIRLSKITADKQKQINREVKSIKSLNIEICNRISCEIKNSEIELEEFDFINEGNNFYIKTNAFFDLKSLKKNSTICDLVSEIITIVFQVNENKLDFRSCFRNDIQDTEHSIISEYGNEVLQEAKSLLDMSDYQKEFWQTVFKIQHKTEFYDFNKNIEKIRQSKYGNIIENIDYQFLSDSDNFPLLKTIFEKLNISVIDFNGVSFTKIDLSKIHLENLKDYFYKNEDNFKSTLWKLLDEKPKGSQTDFLDLISKYENNADFINEKANQLKEDWLTDYESIFEEYLNFHFSFSTQKKEIIHILDKKNQNKINFSNKENDIIEQDKELISLLYFEKNIPFIKTELEKIIEPENTINDNEDKIGSGKIVTDFEVKPKVLTKLNGKGPFIPSGATINNKKVGNRSEKLVYNTLVEKYGKENVSWKAKEDEGLHYDMRYSSNNGNKWKYVEVKTFNNNSFILSREEKKFGENNKNKYEIWLVDNQNNIYNYEIFKGEVTFELTPKDYIISIELKANA